MYSTVETYRDDDISTEWLRIKGHHKVVFSAPSCMCACRSPNAEWSVES